MCQNIEEYIPVLVIGSDGPPKPKKNEELPVTISIYVPNFFLMKLRQGREGGEGGGGEGGFKVEKWLPHK